MRTCIHRVRDLGRGHGPERSRGVRCGRRPSEIKARIREGRRAQRERRETAPTPGERHDPANFRPAWTDHADEEAEDVDGIGGIRLSEDLGRRPGGRPLRRGTAPRWTPGTETFGRGGEGQLDTEDASDNGAWGIRIREADTENEEGGRDEMDYDLRSQGHGPLFPQTHSYCVWRSPIECPECFAESQCSGMSVRPRTIPIFERGLPGRWAGRDRPWRALPFK